MAVLVGKQAPFFDCPEKLFSAVLGNGQIVNDFNFKKFTANKYSVLFFYPLDFTFVCPTELIAFDHRLAEFKARHVEVIGISIDSAFAHHAWRNTPVNEGGIGEVGYPLVADVQHQLCQAYDVESPDGVAFRGTFLMDKLGIVRHQLVNDLPLGRNIDEAIRMVDALQYVEQHGEVCPAGWSKGKKAMKADQAGAVAYLSTNAKEL